MKTIQRKIAALVLVFLVLAGVADAQPVNDDFANATLLTTSSGTTNVDTTLATMETCEPTPINTPDYGGETLDLTNSVWYAWTAPNSGSVEFDTIGSSFDTVLAVYTTTNGLCGSSLTSITNDDDSGYNFHGDTEFTSYLTFNATAGTTYYIEISGNADDFGDFFGPAILNWNQTTPANISSGNFSFTSAVYPTSSTETSDVLGNILDSSVSPSLLGGARATVTRSGGSSGRVEVGYQLVGLTYTNIFTTNILTTNFLTVLTDTNNNVFYTNIAENFYIYTNYFGYYDYANGKGYQQFTNLGTLTNIVLSITNPTIAVTIVGPYGPTDVPTNLPPVGTNGLGFSLGFDTSSNLVFSGTNDVLSPVYLQTKIVSSAPGFTNSTGILTFDDYQMKQDIIVPVQQYSVSAGGVATLPGSLGVVLTSATLDPLESSDLIAPTFSTSTSFIDVYNNTFVAGEATNISSGASIFNFERENFRVDKTTGTTYATIKVTRSGGNASQSVSVSYAIDQIPPIGQYDPANQFSLQADSDYATPGTDFTSVSGTLTWAAYDYLPKSFQVPIVNNSKVEFNEDMQLQLYSPSPNPGATVGDVGTATLTILFDNQINQQQPAGAVDRTWNQDGVPGSNPPFLNYPGTQGGVAGSADGNGGTVYAVATQPDGKSIAAGSFISFDSHTYNYIVRMLNNGYQDTSFLASPNSGANGFISSLALQPDGKIIVAGAFTAFNGYNRYHIARLNTNGTVDTTFNPGLGVNGTGAMVWAVALQTNGQIVIGGQFTSYNGTNISSVARLNADGSLDPGFNPGVGPDGVVYAVAVDSVGRVVIGGAFDSANGGMAGGVARLNVDGSFDTTFGLGIGTYNPDTGLTDPVRALAIDSNGQILVGGSFSYVDLSSYNGLVRLSGVDGTVDTSFNPGTGTYDPLTGDSDTVYSIRLQPDGNILIGGDFAVYNQSRRWGVARIFPDGSLDTSFMDTAYNQFAGLVNHYHNSDAVNTNLYPSGNHRNFVDAIAVESGTTNVIIGGGFLRVGGGYARDDIHPRSNVARLIGGGTPGPGNIELSYPSYSVDKSAGTLFVSMLRTNGSLGPASAAFYTNMAAPGPGIANANDITIANPAYFNPIWPTIYAAFGATYSWMISPAVYGPNYLTQPAPDYATQPYVYLQINNNTNITGNVNANLGLSSPDGSTFMLGGEYIGLVPALGAQAAAPLTIIDDNISPGVLGFSLPQFSVVETNGTATITVTRTNGSDGVVQIYYATSNGTATNGVNYTGVTNFLTFAQGVTSQTFTIPIINITSTQPDKTVNLRLFNVSGGASIGLTNAVLTLINNNFTSGHISFTAATFATNEDQGTALISVNRLGGSTGTINVNALTVTGGTAVNNTNYRSTATNLIWNNNDASTKTLLVPLIHDGLVTTNLTVNLALTNLFLNSKANNNAWGLYTNAVLTINNVDLSGVVQFSLPVYSVKKYSGYALVPVVRTGGSAQTVTVNFSTVDGTARAGVDYTGITNQTLTFTNGQVAQYVNVPILDTNLNSGLLSFSLVLTNASPAAALGTISNAVMDIIDSSVVNETPGSPDTTYSSSAGFNGAVYALALQSNNELIAGGDFTQADGVPRQHIARLEAGGSLDATFGYPSSSLEANGSVRALAIQTDGRIVVGGYFSNFNAVAYNRIVRINQDGSLDSLFNPGSGADNAVNALAETFVGGVRKIVVGGTFATLNGVAFNYLGRMNDDGTPDTAFNSGGLGANGTVYALAMDSSGRAVIGGDFTSYNNVPVSHVARINTDGSLDLTFTNAGANGSVRAVAIQPDGKILIGGAFTSVNGAAMIRIARLNSNGTLDTAFTPGAGANDMVLSIAVQSDSRIILGGQFTACNGVTRNYLTRLLPGGTVDPTINFGAGANAFVAAAVVEEDAISTYPTNVPDEKIIIGGGFTQYYGAAHPYIARIYGGSISGVGAFEFSSAGYQVDETGPSALITVIRTGGTSGTNADGSGDIYVPFATSDGTAVANTDHGVVTNYFTVVTNLDFPAGEVMENIAVPVMDDGVITPNLTVGLALNPVAPAAYGDQPTATLTIINDDSAISFASSSYQVSKNVAGGVEFVGINRSGSTNGTSTVVFNTTTNGTALPGTDYAPLTNVLAVFNPGVTNLTVPVSIYNNGLPEGNQTVTMTLSNALGSALYSPSNATLTIVDTVSLPGVLFLSAPSYNVHSSDTNAYLTVYRTNGFSGTVSVNYGTVLGTALPGVDYISTNGILTFLNGVTNQTITVPLIAQTAVKTPVALMVVLSNALYGATLAAPSNAPVIISSSIAGIAFNLATNTVAENNGAVVIGVQRLYNTNNPVSVSYQTVDGTASNGVNYIGTSGVISFTNGATQAAITISLLNNTNQINNLNFGVVLSSPLGGAQLLAPSNTVVVEQAANAGLSFSTNYNQVLKNAGSVTVMVACSNPQVEPAVTSSNVVPLSVSYYTVNGTAVAGTDYTATSGTLLFTNGIATNSFTIPINNNTLVTGDHQFTVVLANATAPGQVTAPSTQTVDIAESNAGLQFSQSAYTVFKNGVFAGITVNRTGYTNDVVSVNYSATNGTALNGANFVATNGTLVFSNGVTSQSFQVPIIANTQVAPNLTVLLQLFNPTNSVLVAPSAAVLTILENGGSYVIPAGAQLVSESGAGAPNGILDSNENDTVLFAFRDSAGLNVTNLNAILLATNGVTSPVAVPASATNYGPLTVYGHSVSRPFNFTVHGTNSFPVTPTFNLYDNTKFIGTAAFSFTIGSWTTSFANTNVILVRDDTNALPYPATINVSGVGGSLIKATVTLNRFTHTYPHDVDVLVAAPAGTNALIMAHTGSSFSVTNLVLTFDDAATNSLSTTSRLTSGTNKPTAVYPVLPFP